MKKLVVKKNGVVVDIKYGSEEALKAKAKELRRAYKLMGLDYKVSVAKA